MSRGLGLAALLLVCGCEPPCPAPNSSVVACPALAVSGWTWVGAVGVPGSVPPFAEVRLYAGDESVDRARANREGSFAIRGAVRELGDCAVRVVVGGLPIACLANAGSEAAIRYEAGTRPVVEKPASTMQFEGWLGGLGAAAPIERAWMFSWSTGAVREIAGPPRLDEAFVATVPGRAHEEASLVSLHVDGGAGGCWWPSGGGCRCAHCSVADEAAGTCVTSAVPAACGCVPGDPPPANERDPLPVDERRPAPAPETGERIPTGASSSPPSTPPPPPAPVDAGVITPPS